MKPAKKAVKAAKRAPKPKPKAKKIQKPGRSAKTPATGRKPKSAAPAVATPSPVQAEVTPEAIFDALPLKQQNFIVLYLANGFNATNAAKSAGFSARSADTQGSRLLKNDKVRAVIAARAKKSMATREITAERVLDEIAKLAFFDPRRFFRGDGSLVPVHELDEECGAALAGFNATLLFGGKSPIGELRKIKFADKGLNLERLGRHLKLFTDVSEHKVKIETVVLTEALKEPRKLPPSEPEF